MSLGWWEGIHFGSQHTHTHTVTANIVLLPDAHLLQFEINQEQMKFQSNQLPQQPFWLS